MGTVDENSNVCAKEYTLQQIVKTMGGEVGKMVDKDSNMIAREYTLRKLLGAAEELMHNSAMYGVSGLLESSPTLTRLYDAAGLVAGAGTDTATARNDFDNRKPFNRKKCVGRWKMVLDTQKMDPWEIMWQWNARRLSTKWMGRS